MDNKRTGSKKQGAAVRAIRTGLGLSVTEFAVKIRRSGTYVAAIEAGLAPVSGSVLANISTGCGIPFEELVRKTGYKPSIRARRNSVAA